MHERYPKAKKAAAVAAFGAVVLTGCGEQKAGDTTTPAEQYSPAPQATTSAPKNPPSAEATPPEHPNATNPQSFRNGGKAIICEGILAEVTKVAPDGSPSEYHVFGRPVVQQEGSLVPMDVSISKSGFDAAERTAAPGKTAVWFTIRGEAAQAADIPCQEETINTRKAIQPNGSGPYVITTTGETSPARFNLDAASLHDPYEVAGQDFGDGITQVALDQILERAAGDPRP